MHVRRCSLQDKLSQTNPYYGKMDACVAEKNPPFIHLDDLLLRHFPFLQFPIIVTTDESVTVSDTDVVVM